MGPLAAVRVFEYGSSRDEEAAKRLAPEQQSLFEAVGLLASGLQQGDQISISIAISNLKGIPSAEARQLLDRVENAPREAMRTAVAELIFGKIQSARLLLWNRVTKGMLPAMYCPDIETALYASLTLGRDQPVSVCLQCGKLFVASTKRKYCSHRCGNAHRVRKSRQKNRRKVINNGSV